MSSSAEKTLVLAVDYDNDLKKAGLSTPIIGYDSCMEAAQKYALMFPSDADSNTLFTALKIYRELKEEGIDAEISFVAGDEKGGSKAGLALKKQVETVINYTGSTSAILVVDSAEDEAVTPVIASLIKIVGVEKVVVEQMRGVEETYVLFGRYLRKALEEPRFARFFLGLPGALIITYVALSISPYSGYAWSITLALLGLALVLKGFGITDTIATWWRTSPITKVSLTLSILATVLTLTMLYSSFYSRGFSLDVISVATYIRDVMPYALVAIIPIIAGKMAYRFLKKSFKVWREFIAFAVLGVAYQFSMNMSKIILAADTDDLGEILRLFNENYLLQTLALYIAILMTLSVVFYAIEKEVI